MKIKAKFKGTTDKRYENSETYVLDFYTLKVSSSPEVVGITKWTDTGYASSVRYGSLRKFLENWEVL